MCIYAACSTVQCSDIGMNERARRQQKPRATAIILICCCWPAAASCGCNCAPSLSALVRLDPLIMTIYATHSHCHTCMCTLITGQPGMHAHSSMHTNVKWILTRVKIEMHMPSMCILQFACTHIHACMHAAGQAAYCVGADHYEKYMHSMDDQAVGQHVLQCLCLQCIYGII